MRLITRVMPDHWNRWSRDGILACCNADAWKQEKERLKRERTEENEHRKNSNNSRVA